MLTTVTQAPAIPVDELDLRLIAQLETNPRESNLHLARDLGVSPSTVSRKLRRLLDERIIRVVGITDPTVLGYQVRAFLALNVRAGAGDSVAEDLARIPTVQVVFLTTGRYDILAWVVARDSGDFVSLLTGGLSSISGIQSTDIMLALKRMKVSYGMSTTINYAISEAAGPLNLDSLDQALIRELEADGRLSSTELAKKLGISRPTAHSRLRRLTEERAIRFAVIPNLLLSGNGIMAVILLKVQLSALTSVAEKLAAFREVRNVIIVAGGYQMAAWTTFRSTQHMSEFLRNELAVVPGIVTYETLVGLRLAKFSLKLLTRLAPQIGP